MSPVYDDTPIRTQDILVWSRSHCDEGAIRGIPALGIEWPEQTEEGAHSLPFFGHGGS